MIFSFNTKGTSPGHGSRMGQAELTCQVHNRNGLRLFWNRKPLSPVATDESGARNSGGSRAHQNSQAATHQDELLLRRNFTLASRGIPPPSSENVAAEAIAEAAGRAFSRDMGCDASRQADEIRRSGRRARADLRRSGISGDKIIGPAMNVVKLPAPATENENFFPPSACSRIATYVRSCRLSMAQSARQHPTKDQRVRGRDILSRIYSISCNHM